MLRIDQHLLRGTIDLLIDGQLIVDYKTGLPSEGELAEYETQLQLYAAALCALTGVASPEAVLVLLDAAGDFVRRVDCSPPALDRVLEQARNALTLVAAPCAAV
jgi:hypothetical protein